MFQSCRTHPAHPSKNSGAEELVLHAVAIATEFVLLHRKRGLKEKPRLPLPRGEVAVVKASTT